MKISLLLFQKFGIINVRRGKWLRMVSFRLLAISKILRAIFFNQICAEIFMIYEVNLEKLFWSRQKRKWSRKPIVFRLNLFLLQIQIRVRNSLSWICFFFTCGNLTLIYAVFFQFFNQTFFSKWCFPAIYCPI